MNSCRDFRVDNKQNRSQQEMAQLWKISFHAPLTVIMLTAVIKLLSIETHPT